MRTSREEVIRAFERALKYTTDDAKVSCLRYYIELDGTFDLPRNVSVISADRESPNELLQRLIQELKNDAQGEKAEIEEFLIQNPAKD